MGEAGLRASEVTALREEDLLELPSGRYQLRVIGKGNKERPVSLPPDLGRELRRFLRRRAGSGRIFLSRLRARGDYQPLDKNALPHIWLSAWASAWARRPRSPSLSTRTSSDTPSPPAQHLGAWIR